MKVGIEFADLVNTVSKNYAREIQSGPEFGYGLEGVIRRRNQDLWGIVNGIDYTEWDPGRDPLIPEPFCAENLKGKKTCKAAVRSALGLPLSSGESAARWNRLATCGTEGIRSPGRRDRRDRRARSSNCRAGEGTATIPRHVAVYGSSISRKESGSGSSLTTSFPIE